MTHVTIPTHVPTGHSDVHDITPMTIVVSVAKAARRGFITIPEAV